MKTELKIIHKLLDPTTGVRQHFSTRDMKEMRSVQKLLETGTKTLVER